MNDVCQVCGGRIESSCCCLLTDMISQALDVAGVKEFWITDIKYNYPEDSCIEESVVKFEPIDLKMLLSSMEE